jgi:hypothetical protein
MANTLTEEPASAKRRDEALAWLLKMPSKPHEDMKLGKQKGKTGQDEPGRSPSDQ